MNKASILPYDIAQLNLYGTTIVAGASGSGKTSFLRSLLSVIKDRYDALIAVCGSTESIEIYSKYTNRALIHSGFDESAIEKIILKQNITISEHGAHKALRLLVIFDDVHDQKAVKSSQIMRTLAMKGRHAQIHSICVVQALTTVDAAVRANARTLFFLRNKSTQVIESIRNLIGVDWSLPAFATIFQRCTKDFSVMAVDTSKAGNDSVFHFKLHFDPDMRFTVLSQRMRRMLDQQSLSGEEIRRQELENQKSRLAQLNSGTKTKKQSQNDIEVTIVRRP